MNTAFLNKRKFSNNIFRSRTAVLGLIGFILGISFISIFLLKGDRAAAWWNDNWGYRRKITIDHTKVSGSNDLTDFPVFISFTSDTDLSANANSDGSDILFTDAGGNRLDHEIEYYSAGTLAAWVRISNLSYTNDTVLYMYYGNPVTPSQQNIESVWSDDYRGVWHLSETSGQHLDSTSNNNDSTAVNVTTQGSATGKVGGASDFASGNEVIVADSDSLDISGSFTAQAWVKADTIGGSGTWNSIIYKSGNSNYFLELTNTDEIDAGFYGGGDWRSVATSTSPVTTGTFYHLAVVHDAAADTIKVYVDGVEKGSATGITQTPLVNTGTFTIGENFYNETFDGIIDEVRLSDSPKSVDWLLTEYNNQNSPSTFYSTGYAEERKLGPAAYWKFDEGYGTSVNDTSGNANIGIMGTGSSAPTWRTEESCVNGNCLEFDGTSDYINAGDILDFTGNTEMTVSAWIKLISAPSSRGQIISKYDAGTSGQWYFGVDSQKKVIFLRECGSYGITGNNALSLSTWNYVSGVYDGTNLKIYVNGILDESASDSCSISNTSVDTVIGAGDNGTGVEDHFPGFIDELKVYPYARTEDEIKQDYLFSSAKGASAVLGTQDQSFLSNGLVGYWKMDETTGTTGPSWTALDSSGNGNNGTGAGNAGPGVGKFGNGGSFDGTGDSVNLGSETTLDDLATDEFSVQAWAYLDTAPASNDDQVVIISKGDNTDFKWHLSVRNNSGSTQYNATLNNVAVSRSANTTIVGGWHHVIMTYNDDTDRQIRIYVDGSEVTYATQIPMSGSYSSDASKNLRIGSHANETTYWDGKIDEVRIYNRELSATEVRSLYQWAPGPEVYYKFDDGSGTSAAIDSSGNNANGTLGGSISESNWVPGKYGKALHMSGNDYVRSTDDLSVAGLGQFTISTWLYINTLDSTTRNIFLECRAADCNTRATLVIATDNQLRFAARDDDSDGSTTNCVDDNRNLTTKVWTHVSFVYDSQSGNHSIYLNGVPLTQSPGGNCSNEFGTGVNSSFKPIIGSSYNGGGNFFDGYIDEFKMYSYAQSREQIIRDMNAGHPAVGTPVGSTSLHYSFDEGYGTTVHDKSPSQIHGTLGSGVSAPSWTNDGKFGKALSFDGSNDYAYATSPGLPTGDFSYSLWFNTSAPGSSDTLLYSGDGSGGNEFKLDKPGSSQVVSLRLNDSTACTGTITIEGSTWYHVVATRSGSDVKTYVNGELNCSGTYATTLDFGSCPLVIGADDSSSACNYSGINEVWAGTIDEVKVYSFALTTDQINTISQNGKTMLLGAKSTASDGTTPSNSAGREYCVPGDSATCNPPVGEWKFDEGVGGAANDTSGNGNNGTLGSGSSAPTWTQGKYGKALSFDGVDDYVNLSATSLNTHSYGEFALSAWYKSADTNINDEQLIWFHSETFDGNYELVNFGPTDDAGYIGKLRLTLASDAVETQYYGTTNIVDKQWHHLVAVRTGTRIKLYVDGVLESDTADIDAGIVLTVTSGTPLGPYIGDEPGNAEQVYGFIDNVRLYDYARTPAQIAWEYNRGAPIAWYKMDECQGTTIYNAALNADGKAAGNNGTLTIGGSGTSSVGNCSTSSTAWGNGASGKINSSIDLDGTDDYITVTDTNVLDFGTSTAFTVSAWVYIPTGSDGRNIVTKGDDSGGGDGSWGFDHHATNNLNFFISPDDASWCTIKSTNALTKDTWHHVVAVINRNGTCTTSDIVLYDNGKVMTSSVVFSSANANANVDNNDPLYVGYKTGSSYFNGQVDDVRIYGYALTSNQVQQAYNNGAVSFR